MTQSEFDILCGNILNGYEVEDEWKDPFIETVNAMLKILTPKQRLKIFEDATLQ